MVNEPKHLVYAAWSKDSQKWYLKASNSAPTTGRLYYRLAILAGPNTLQKICLFTKSLCVAIPCPLAIKSIHTLLDPVLAGSQHQLPPIIRAFIKTHDTLFEITYPKGGEIPKPKDEIWAEHDIAITDFITNLDVYIANMQGEQVWTNPGTHIAITNCNPLLEYGLVVQSDEPGIPNPLMTILRQPSTVSQSQRHHGLLTQLPKSIDAVMRLSYVDSAMIESSHTLLFGCLSWCHHGMPFHIWRSIQRTTGLRAWKPFQVRIGEP